MGVRGMLDLARQVRVILLSPISGKPVVVGSPLDMTAELDFRVPVLLRMKSLARYPFVLAASCGYGGKVTLISGFTHPLVISVF